MRAIKTHLRSGFTLIELMIVMAVVAVLLMVVAPSFRDLMEVQRVRGVSDGFITDVQFARTEAASRQEVVGISFKPPAAANTCYIVHTCGSSLPANCKCDCSAAAGSRCPDPLVVSDPPREIRTVQLGDSAVNLIPVLASGNPVNPAVISPTSISFDPATGAMTAHYPIGFLVTGKPPGGAFWAKVSSKLAGSTVILRDVVSTSGRPSTCKPSGSTIGGAASC